MHVAIINIYNRLVFIIQQFVYIYVSTIFNSAVDGHTLGKIYGKQAHVEEENTLEEMVR